MLLSERLNLSLIFRGLRACLSGSMFSSLTLKGLPTLLPSLYLYGIIGIQKRRVLHWHPLALQSEVTFSLNLLVKSRVRTYENSQPKVLRSLSRLELILAWKEGRLREGFA